jgi:glycosyltransferase involved in cell wall biosynthesis
MSSLYPGLNPAGHMLETNFVSALRAHFDIRSAGILPLAPPKVENPRPNSGIAHELVLIEKWPELFHRLQSLRALKRQYLEWGSAGWKADLVLVYNLSPIYNQFLRWLQNLPGCPKRVLILLDSPNLGERLPALKRLRRKFKPMHIPDSAMLPLFDACIGLSKTAERYFQPRGVPFFWMPGGVLPERAILKPEGAEGPVRFGYYGALGAHAGVRQMTDVFLTTRLEATLDICGYGKAGDDLARLARKHSRLRFHGLLAPDDCLRFGRQCDVLINPRPATHGNENNFASKVFDYALTGRAILTSRLSGVDSVLGSEAYYFDPSNFDFSLKKQMHVLASVSRDELNAHGRKVQQRILREYSWEAQARRVAEFLNQSVL